VTDGDGWYWVGQGDSATYQTLAAAGTGTCAHGGTIITADCGHVACVDGESYPTGWCSLPTAIEQRYGYVCEDCDGTPWDANY
jgi:hypothetical protein